jgi:hypothetical protein
LQVMLNLALACTGASSHKWHYSFSAMWHS